jgi:Methylase involved in ubiquinone/menaquinone biosynthesis
MSEFRSPIQSQYEHGSLLAAIDAALEEANPSRQHLTVEDLAPVDAFHIRGREATRELLEELPLPEAPAVLDVGCGLGGTARFLADECGAQVLGVDVTEEYCEVARELTRRVQLDDQITFRQGNALDLPIERDRFDLVVSEHVQMNVSDKQGYVREMARVLKPGGLLALYGIFAGIDGARHYPVPWADEPSVSFLVRPDAFRDAVTAAGLTVLDWDDCTEEGRTWFEKTLQKVQREGPPPVGLHLLMGGSAKEKMKNVIRNLREERIAIVSTVARKPE